MSGGDIEKRLERAISEFTLPNGMHFIVMQRHRAPIVSCHVHANVGAFDEELGRTGRSCRTVTPYTLYPLPIQSQCAHYTLGFKP